MPHRCGEIKAAAEVMAGGGLLGRRHRFEYSSDALPPERQEGCCDRSAWGRCLDDASAEDVGAPALPPPLLPLDPLFRKNQRTFQQQKKNPSFHISPTTFVVFLP
jgi:hypothetical protein